MRKTQSGDPSGLNAGEFTDFSWPLKDAISLIHGTKAAALAHGIVGPATNQSRIGGKAENIYSMSACRIEARRPGPL
jgi:hypothetical protein